VYTFSNENNFSKNSIIQDYAINLLKSVRESKPVIILVDGDSQLFATRYAQIVLGVHPEYVVGNSRLLFFDWFSSKIIFIFNDFNFQTNQISKSRKYSLENDLLEPNLNKFTFVMTRNYNSENFKTTYMTLGRKISKGKGIEFEPYLKPILTEDSSIISHPLSEYNIYRDIYSEYAYYYLAKGINNYRLNQRELARKTFEDALRIVPYCLPAQTNLCQLLESLKSPDLPVFCSTSIKELNQIYNYYK
jgi:hypothetical protein